MALLKLITALARANKFVNGKKGKFLDAKEQLSDDNAPDLDESAEPVETTTETGATASEYQRHDERKAPQPLKGAGTATFMDLAPSVMQFWLETLQAMRPAVVTGSTDTVIDVPQSALVEGIQVETAGADVNVSELANANNVEPYHDEDAAWDFLWLVFLGIISYYGIKLVYKGGQWVITTTADGIKRVLSEFTNIDTTTVMNIEKLNMAETDGGIGNILLGRSDYRISTRYKEVDKLHPKGHTGVDYAGVGYGAPVHTALSGIVTFTRTGSPTAGNYVEVYSDSGFVQRFLHLDRITVQQGQRIAIGDQIGTVGSTGQSTGPHLHYEVYKTSAGPKMGETIHNDAAYTNIDPTELARYIQANAQEVGIVKASDRPDFMMATAVPDNQNMVLPKYQSPTAKGYNYMSVTTTGKTKWEGQTGTTSNSAVTLVTFKSPEYGWRAGMKNLLRFQTAHDVSHSDGQYVTIADIATNDRNHSYVETKNGDRPEQWASNVAKGSGFKTTDRLDLRDPETLARVAAGIGFAEHSVKTDTGYLQTIIRSFNITDGPVSNKQ